MLWYLTRLHNLMMFLRTKEEANTGICRQLTLKHWKFQNLDVHFLSRKLITMKTAWCKWSSSVLAPQRSAVQILLGSHQFFEPGSIYSFKARSHRFCGCTWIRRRWKARMRRWKGEICLDGFMWMFVLMIDCRTMCLSSLCHSPQPMDAWLAAGCRMT